MDKTMRWPPHLLGLIAPIYTFLSLYLGSWWMLSAIILVLVIYPILDFVFGKSPPVEPALEGLPFAFIIHFHGLMVPINIAYLLYLIIENSLSGMMLFGVITVGLSTGASGIVTAHELGHRRPRSFSWWLARIDLLSALYLHYTVEHNHTHHKHWARECDPTSSKLGRGFYIHLLQTVPRQIKGAYKAKPGDVKIGFALEIALLVGLAVISKYVLAAFLLQAVIAIILLEFTNYLQHHGLIRAADERGTAQHAWESRHRWSRWTLLELPLHPAHHLKASTPYDKLTTIDDAPQLKYGYYVMFWISLIPPLWHKVMANEIKRNEKVFENNN